MSKSIPDRWIEYAALGKVIQGTRIICFKVPLRTIVQKNNSEIKEIWDIKTLLERIPKLGAVVDLTNTSRYYNPKDLEAAGILHKKILMPGRIIPPKNKVTEFMNTIDEFLGRDCDFLVGVHCTHGLNRTGYMVCNYMKERLGIPPQDAIRKFEEARGYQIERKNYIADIIGHKPPPPDIGENTIVKPIQRRHDYSYKSPLEDDGPENPYTSRSRFGNNRYKRTERSREPASGTSYDYRYDY